MAKKGMDISSVTQVLRDVKVSGGWSLRIGAGTSVPVVPNWFSLVEKLINKHCKTKDRIDIQSPVNIAFTGLFLRHLM